MEKTVRWGIAGAGNIANKFAKAVKNFKGAELVAVASRSEEKSRAFADRHNIENIFVGYEKMAKSGLVDAVYIATLHPFHKVSAELFINEKKHVLCEKPVCVNKNQAVELMECANKNGVFLMEAMWTRFLPAIKEAVKIVNRGEIGEIKGVSADFCCYTTPESDDSLYNNNLAGGSLLDVGIYGLNFAAIFLGNNPESIVSVADIDYGVDCHTNILMKYKNGTIASVSSAINVGKPANANIYGTKGHIVLPRFYGAQEIILNVNNEQRHILMPSIGDGFEEEIIEACSCIRSGKTQSDIMPMSESIKILEQMDYIRKQINLKYPFDV